MRSSAGIVAGLFLIGLVANCGGDDTTTNTPTGGTNTAGGEGGQGNVGNKNTGGTQNLSGTKNTSGTDAGGMPPMIECSVDKDCGAGAKCVDNACKKDDGETCTASAECQNTCIDGMCTGKLDDGQACTADTDCAHTCIDGMCAMPSDVGGDSMSPARAVLVERAARLPSVRLLAMPARAARARHPRTPTARPRCNA